MPVSAKQAGFLVLALLVLLLGFYAVKLNADFYRLHVPFFDSCSYTGQLAAIMAKARSEGLMAAAGDALHGNVALPWLEAAAVARFTAPSRALGIWLQWPWLALLAFSLYWYFTQYRNLSPVFAVCFTLPFVSFARIFDWNGGLPDFRMDLSLYVFVSLASVWYLITYETESALPWFLSGCAAMLACIGRATAPVYLGVMIGPLWLLRLWRAPRGRRAVLLRNTGWMVLPVSVGLLFQVYNFHFLYFYYAVIEGDANRHLPLTQSAMHLILAGSHLGVALAGASLAILALNLGRDIGKRLGLIDWTVLWLALAPVLFLMIAGAGLNPFVSMPAVFGFLLFSYFPLRQPGMVPAGRIARWAVCVLLPGACLWNVVEARRPQLFTGADTTRMDGMKALVQRINADAAIHKRGEVRYIIPEIGEFHQCSFDNVLIYEYGGTPRNNGEIKLPSGPLYVFPGQVFFGASQPGDWDRDFPGKSDSARMDTVTSMAIGTADYLLLPTGQALDFLEQHRSFNFINEKVRELKRRLLATGLWVRLGDPVAISPDESIEVYSRIANRRS